MTSEPSPQYYDTLKDRFVCHAQVLEQTKVSLVLIFVFVLAHNLVYAHIMLRDLLILFAIYGVTYQYGK